MSDPDVPEIPGFYYDTEKHKYFKVLSDNAASSSSSGSSSFYTPSTIAERESKKQKIRDDAKQKLARVQYRPRHSLSKSPYLHWTLDRQLGLGTPMSWRAAYKEWTVKKLVYKEFIPAANLEQGVSNLFVQRMGGTVYFIVGMENGDITSFCANGVGDRGLGLGDGIKGFKERDVWKSEMEQKIQRDGEVREGRLIKSDASLCKWDFKLPAMVTGILAIENGESNLEVLVSSLSGVFSHQVLSETAHFFPRTHRPGGSYSMKTNNSDRRPTLSMGHSTAKQTILYGLERGIAFGQADGRARARGAITNLSTDIFAVYPLPPDAPSHTGFLTGGRDGTVRLFDVRANPQTCAPIVLNVGSVRHIQGVGQTGLAIRCVDSCAIYDLRTGRGRNTPGAKTDWASTFYVPDGDGKKGGFDIYQEMGLMAVEGGTGGSGNNEKAVYLFDIHSCNLLGKVPPGQVKLLEPEGRAGWPIVAVAGERGVGVYEW